MTQITPEIPIRPVRRYAFLTVQTDQPVGLRQRLAIPAIKSFPFKAFPLRLFDRTYSATCSISSLSIFVQPFFLDRIPDSSSSSQSLREASARLGVAQRMIPRSLLLPLTKDSSFSNLLQRNAELEEHARQVEAELTTIAPGTLFPRRLLVWGFWRRYPITLLRTGKDILFFAGLLVIKRFSAKSFNFHLSLDVVFESRWFPPQTLLRKNDDVIVSQIVGRQTASSKRLGLVVGKNGVRIDDSHCPGWMSRLSIRIYGSESVLGQDPSGAVMFDERVLVFEGGSVHVSDVAERPRFLTRFLHLGQRFPFFRRLLHDDDDESADLRR